METKTQDAMSQALAIIAALNIPDVQWIHGDDLCDCTFQRIGYWTNPYLAETLLVRMCCIWNEIYKQYPEYVQKISAYHDLNTNTYYTEPADWNGEEDMPRYMWYRHLARKEGRSLAEIREMYADQEPPKGVVRN